jgi:hypothetical protein
MWQKIIPIENTYGKNKKCSQNLSSKCHFYKKALGQLHKKPQSPWWL